MGLSQNERTKRINHLHISTPNFQTFLAVFLTALIPGRFLEQCPADQLDFDPRSSLCCGKLYDPIVDKMERVQFEAAFDAMRPDVDDKIDTESFVESLISIPMPPGALGRIAVMADHDKVSGGYVLKYWHIYDWILNIEAYHLF